MNSSAVSLNTQKHHCEALLNSLKASSFDEKKKAAIEAAIHAFKLYNPQETIRVKIDKRFINASLNGNRKAQFKIGEIYFNRKSFNIAKCWWHLSAFQGKPRSQIVLGLINEHDEGDNKSLVYAMEWYAKAAQKEQAKGKRYFFRCLNKLQKGESDLSLFFKRLNGEEKEKFFTLCRDRSLADFDSEKRKWIKLVIKSMYFLENKKTSISNYPFPFMAAIDNDREALFKIGFLFLLHSTKISGSWFKLAGEQGHPKASYYLDHIRNQG